MAAGVEVGEQPERVSLVCFCRDLKTADNEGAVVVARTVS